MEFVRGKKDKVKRRVGELVEPQLSIPRKKFGVDTLQVGYVICQVELEPGKFVLQLIGTHRIEHQKEAA